MLSTLWIVNYSTERSLVILVTKLILDVKLRRLQALYHAMFLLHHTEPMLGQSLPKLVQYLLVSLIRHFQE